MNLREEIDGAKKRLPLPALLERLGLAECAHKTARCPLHEDLSPSFSVFCGAQGWRWKCHAGCGEGDEIDFLEKHNGTTRAEAIRCFLELASGSTALPSPSPSPQKAAAESCGPILPPDASPGTFADWQELAALRKIAVIAPATAAQHLGTLLFGTVCGCRSWILTDCRRLCAEARRMDGKLFTAVGNLGERKAHTIKGSMKAWPVGLAVRTFKPSDFRALLGVEGGPDYLAALDFTLHAHANCLPIAFLGAGAGGVIHPDALRLLRTRRIRLYPHTDSSGATAARKWARQIAANGATVDAFSFCGLRKADGSPVKDLNDCTQIHIEDAGELGGLLP